MYTKELLAFITVADEGSFLKASQKLYLTPASVMNQINKLEAQAGVKLLVRTNQGARLTDAGRVIYKAGTEIIKKSSRAFEKARQAAEAERNSIKIGTSLLRPCKYLLDLWRQADDGSLKAGIKIVPFDDSPAAMAAMLQSLGSGIDCFIGPCEALDWQKQHNICRLGISRCCVAVPCGHRLAGKKLLTWSDLVGENLVLVKKGESPIVDRIREEISAFHPGIGIVDTPSFYDIEVFNSCWQHGYLMEVPELWSEVHPSLVTVPVDWEYSMGYGIIYAKNPSPAAARFVELISNFVNAKS